MTVFLTKLILHALRQVPLSAARFLGRILGRLIWFLGLREKHVALVNIRLAYPHLSMVEQRHLAHRSVLAAGEWFSELGLAWTGTEADLRKFAVSVEGEEAVKSAREKGCGSIFLAPHLGNWEFAGLLMNMEYPMACLYEPPQDADFEDFIVNARGRFGMVTHPTTPKGVVALTRALKSGQTVGILPDQVPRDLSAGCNVSFMGQSCFTPTLAVKLAQKTGAKIFYLTAIRVAKGFVVRILPAADALYERDMFIALDGMNKGIEHLIKDHPEQYQWTYKRFRTRPANGPNHYQRG